MRRLAFSKYIKKGDVSGTKSEKFIFQRDMKNK